MKTFHAVFEFTANYSQLQTCEALIHSYSKTVCDRLYLVNDSPVNVRELLLLLQHFPCCCSLYQSRCIVRSSTVACRRRVRSLKLALELSSGSFNLSIIRCIVLRSCTSSSVIGYRYLLVSIV